jgi:predicted MPP superfamily phosphohydrolase
MSPAKVAKENRANIKKRITFIAQTSKIIKKYQLPGNHYLTEKILHFYEKALLATKGRIEFGEQFVFLIIFKSKANWLYGKRYSK